MKTIKVKHGDGVPKDYTGIVEWEGGDKAWYKNGKFHRENEYAYIGNKNYKEWWLDGKPIWNSNMELDLINQIILSKTQHPEYPLAQVWKILNKNEVYEQLVIPGMDEYIQE